MDKIACIATAAAFAAAIQATDALALHRCVGKDGKVTYTEFECDADAKKSAVTIRDSSGVESRKPGDPARDAKPAVVGGPSLVRPGEAPKPVAVQSAGGGVPAVAPGAAKPGQ